MVGWHHRLSGQEFDQNLGVGDGQGSLACCSPWGHEELDMTERLNNIQLRALILHHKGLGCLLKGVTLLAS